MQAEVEDDAGSDRRPAARRSSSRSPSAGSPAASSTSRPPRSCGTRQQARVEVAPSRARGRRSRAWTSSCSSCSRCVARDAGLVEQRRVQRRRCRARCGSRPARSRRARGTGRVSASAVPAAADQLEPGLQLLARLAALRAHGAVGALEVAEAQRRLDVGVARRDHARDRDRHVRAQHQRPRPSRRTAGTRARGAASPVAVRLVLERGRVHLAVAGVVEHARAGRP